MKINLLAGCCPIRAAILSFLSPLMSKLILEHIKDDPCQQENHMSNGVCPDCESCNSENSIAADGDTYSILKLNAGIISGAQQTLSFERTSKTPGKLMIGIERDKALLLSRLSRILGAFLAKTKDRGWLAIDSNADAVTDPGYAPKRNIILTR